MKHYIDFIRARGAKITPQRRAILEAFLECQQLMTAQQILDHVRKTYPDIGLDTIYRNVNLLITLGVVAQINIPGKDGNLFELMDGTNHHHHAVCIRCGKTACLDFCPIDDQEIEQLERNGFTLVSHSLQFFGYCRSCQC